MNLFILDYNISKSVRYHVDKHVVKIPLEAAQLACNARIFHSQKTPYSPAQINNPVSKFARSNIASYNFVCEYGLALCREYTYRYDKRHACQDVLLDCQRNPPPLPDGGLRFLLCMPDYCKVGNAVESYRRYYLKEKTHLFSWKKRGVPRWLIKRKF